jgi:hypothetical protein
MGREIRQVPPNWDHPNSKDDYGRNRLQPMYDETFDNAMEMWLGEFDRVRSGDLTDDEREWYPRGLGDWLTDNSAPHPDYYRPWKDEEATWWQVWETVSEGTPVTPPFATQDELVDYLVKQGDFWQQQRWAEGHRDIQPNPPGYSREAAEKFVKGTGWAPSLVTFNGPSGVVIKEGIEAL